MADGFVSAVAGHDEVQSDGVWIDLTTAALTLSVAVNVCVLLLLVTARIVQVLEHWRPRRTSGLEEKHHEDHVDDLKLLPTAITEVFLSTVCLAAGLFVVTSPTLWRCPFTVDAVCADDYRMISILLVAAIGRFIFSLSRLLLAAEHPPPTAAATAAGRSVNETGSRAHVQWMWCRGIYCAATIVCLTTVAVTRQNVVVAAAALLLELENGVEELSAAVHRRAAAASSSKTSKYDDDDGRRRAVEAVFIGLGLTVVVVQLILPGLLVGIATGHQSPLGLGAASFGVLCFAVTFYTTTAAFCARRQLVRLLRRRRDEVDRASACRRTTRGDVEPGRWPPAAATVVGRRGAGTRFERHPLQVAVAFGKGAATGVAVRRRKWIGHVGSKGCGLRWRPEEWRKGSGAVHGLCELVLTDGVLTAVRTVRGRLRVSARPSDGQKSCQIRRTVP